MNLNYYRELMRAADLTIRTFGNQKDKGPVLFYDLAAHCPVVELRFYRDGWKPDLKATFEVYVNAGDYPAEVKKLKDALDYAEGEIKAWEALNGRE